LRPRLAFLVDLVRDLAGSARRPAPAPRPRPAPTTRPSTEAASAHEMKRRLDETRERLKRETPPQPS
jgi:hypothetical protein